MTDTFGKCSQHIDICTTFNVEHISSFSSLDVMICTEVLKTIANIRLASEVIRLTVEKQC